MGHGQRLFFRSLGYVSALTASLALFPVHQLGGGQLPLNRKKVKKENTKKKL